MSYCFLHHTVCWRTICPKPQIQPGQRIDWEQPWGEGCEVTVNKKLNMTQLLVLTLVISSAASKEVWPGGDCPFYSVLIRPPSGVLCSVLNIKAWAWWNEFREAPQNHHKTGTPLLWKKIGLELFSLEERGFWGYLIPSFHYLKRAHKTSGEGL